MFSDFECSIVWPEISPDNNFVEKSKGKEANKTFEDFSQSYT